MCPGGSLIWQHFPERRPFTIFLTSSLKWVSPGSEGWPWTLNDGLDLASMPGSHSFFETGQFFFWTQLSWTPFWEECSNDRNRLPMFWFPPHFLSEPMTRSLGKEIYALSCQRQELNPMSYCYIKHSSISLSLEVGCLIASWPLNENYVYLEFR